MRGPRSSSPVLALLTCVAWVGCSEPAPRVEPVPARVQEPETQVVEQPAEVPTAQREFAPAPPEERERVAPEPAAPVATDCALELRARLRKRTRAEYDLEVEAHNKTGEALRFTLPSRCPQGPFDFSGLPADYDYYQSCAKGMCAQGDPESFQLAAGERRVLESTSISPKGGNCQPALKPGVYEIRPVVPKLPFDVCVIAATLDLRDD